MNIYIWKNVDHLTDNYHCDGGCAVIANSLEEARLFIPKTCPSKHEKPEENVCTAQTENPDFEAPIFDVVAEVFIFPNAGCC